ncbi:hypothetical protein [Saccharopolyspora cebuensis]|uniref:Antibiotic biosynthesis monooxygenase n=1 Tax=Saccharopolyspora cebuensis TaxID=418759 RepID=A0ABV4CNR6_9PSEU
MRDAMPDFTRPDAGTVLISPWDVDDHGRQRRAVDATIAEWERAPKPAAFLSLTCFTSLDGRRVLNYAQWTDDEAHREFVRRHRPELVRGIDDAVPDIERPGLVRYRLHRSTGPVAAERGGVVSVEVHPADGPEQARRLADDLADAARDATAHVHVDVDGTRVLVLREWRDAPAHLEQRSFRLYRSLVHRPRS